MAMGINEDEEWEDDTFLTDSLSLKHLLELHPLPQMVKVTQGIYTDLDISTGDVYMLNKAEVENQTVTMKFQINGETRRFSLSTSHPAKFRVLPFHEDYSFHYKTAADLINERPFVVRARLTYKENGIALYEAGEQLKLTRIVNISGKRFLECLLLRKSQLVQLPEYCIGNFAEVDTGNYLTIKELVESLPNRRRLRLAPGVLSANSAIPNLPPNFDGDIWMDEPRFIIEASPRESPGDSILIPLDLGIEVSPRESTYGGSHASYYQLDEFVLKNVQFFPLNVVVAEWDESTTLLENSNIQPGTHLVMHDLVENVPKLLAKAQDLAFVIPTDYAGEFVETARFYDSVQALQDAKPTGILCVTETTCPEPPMLESIHKGDHIKVKDYKLCFYRPEGCNPDEEIEYIWIQKIDKKTEKVTSEMQVPTCASLKCSSILSKQETTKFSLKNVMSEIQNFPSSVKIVSEDPFVPAETDLIQGRLNFGDTMLLTGFFVEDCVLVSSNDTAIRLPLRTKIYVSHISSMDEARTSIKPVSPLDRCPELISNRETLDKLEILAAMYEKVDPTESVKNRKVKQHSYSVADQNKPPRPRRYKSCPTQYRGKPSNQGDYSYDDVFLKKENVDEKGDDDSDDNYTYVDQKDTLPFPLKDVELPPDGNLYRFNVMEMASAFRVMGLSQGEVQMCVARKIDGKKFSKMSKDELSEILLHDVKNKCKPLVLHFHKCTRKTLASAVKIKIHSVMSKFL